MLDRSGVGIPLGELNYLMSAYHGLWAQHYLDVYNRLKLVNRRAM